MATCALEQAVTSTVWHSCNSKVYVQLSLLGLLSYFMHPGSRVRRWTSDVAAHVAQLLSASGRSRHPARRLCPTARSSAALACPAASRRPRARRCRDGAAAACYLPAVSFHPQGRWVHHAAHERTPHDHWQDKGSCDVASVCPCTTHPREGQTRWMHLSFRQAAAHWFSFAVLALSAAQLAPGTAASECSQDHANTTFSAALQSGAGPVSTPTSTVSSRSQDQTALPRPEIHLSNARERGDFDWAVPLARLCTSPVPIDLEKSSWDLDSLLYSLCVRPVRRSHVVSATD